MKGLKALKEFYLDKTLVTGSGFADLTDLTSLEKLTITAKVTNASLKGLSHLVFLTDLNLADNFGITDAGLKELNTLGKLKFLNLTRTRVTAAGEKQLMAARPNCAILR